MQRQSLAGVNMKFTRVFTPEWDQQQDTAQWTVSLLGQRGDPANGQYYNLNDCNPDTKLEAFARDYQQFSIYGVSCKMIFPEPSSVEASPVQWSMAYSPNYNLKPNLTGDTIQSMSSFQTGPCSQNKSVTRYFPLSYTKKKLAIDYCDINELVDANGTFNPIGWNANPTTPGAEPLYNGQLPVGTGASCTFRVYRNIPQAQQVGEVKACRFQLTYYLRFRGIRGRTDLE